MQRCLANHNICSVQRSGNSVIKNKERAISSCQGCRIPTLITSAKVVLAARSRQMRNYILFLRLDCALSAYMIHYGSMKDNKDVISIYSNIIYVFG